MAVVFFIWLILFVAVAIYFGYCTVNIPTKGWRLFSLLGFALWVIWGTVIMMRLPTFLNS